MTLRASIPALILGVAIVASAGSGPVARAEDPTGESLPKGAMVRLANGPLHFRYASQFTLLAPEYKTIAVADGQTRIRRYDLATGQPLDKVARDLAYGGPLVVSRDGKRAIHSTPGTGVVAVRDVATGKEIQSLKMPAGFAGGYIYGAATVSLSTDGKVLAQAGVAPGANAKGEVVVWDVDNNAELARVSTFQRGPALPFLSPDGTILATRSMQPNYPTAPPGSGKIEKPEFDPNRTLQIWSVETGKELFKASITGTSYQVTGFAFSPGGSLMAASCGDGPIDIWDVPEKKLKATLLGRTRQGHRLAFSPDGKTLAAASADGTIQRWSVADRKLLGTTEGPPLFSMPLPHGLEFSDNDRVVAWSSVGMFPMVWEAPSGKMLTPIPEHTQAIKSIGFPSGGKEIVTGGQDGRLVRWDVATGKSLGEVKLKTGRTTVGLYRQILHISPDGTRAIMMGTPGTVFDLTTGIEVLAIPGPQIQGGYQMQFAPSSDLSKVAALATTYNPKQSGSCIVWDLVEQKKLGEVELMGNTPGGTPAAAISPSGTRVVTATYAPAPPGGGRPSLLITGWDLKTGKKLGEVEDTNVTGQVFMAAASEMSAIVSTTGGRLRLYDYEAGKFGDEIEPASPRGGGSTGHVVFSADGKRFAIGLPADEQNLYAVRVYDWPSAKPLHTFTGHRAPVTAVAFSPDGKLLASGAQDTSVLVWDMSLVKGE